MRSLVATAILIFSVRFPKAPLLLIILGTGLLIGLIYIYYQYNPAHYTWFPKCPFRALTGLQCPGCGSQRAIHALLHGHVGEAFRQNALVPMAIPYVMIGFYLRGVSKPSEKMLIWRKILFGEWAIKIFAVVVILQFTIRNLL